MKLKFDQSSSSANGWTYVEAQTLESFKFLFNADRKPGVIIQAPVFDDISGVPEFTIIEDPNESIYPKMPPATLLTRNIDEVRLWLEKGQFVTSQESREVLRHEINYKNSIIDFVVLETQIERAVKQTNVFYLKNTFCIRFKSGRFAGESFFLFVTFEISHSSNTIPKFCVCLSKLKSNCLFDASGLLMLE